MTTVRKLNTNGPRHFEYDELVEKEEFKLEFLALCQKYDVAFVTCGCCTGLTKYSEKAFNDTIGYFV